MKKLYVYDGKYGHLSVFADENYCSFNEVKINIPEIYAENKRRKVEVWVILKTIMTQLFGDDLYDLFPSDTGALGEFQSADWPFYELFNPNWEILFALNRIKIENRTTETTDGKKHIYVAYLSPFGERSEIYVSHLSI